jgi:hypothetical protein
MIILKKTDRDRDFVIRCLLRINLEVDQKIEYSQPVCEKESSFNYFI